MEITTRRGAAVGTVSTAVLVAATVTTGLMAGLFAGFSYAVMPGLGRADDAAFVSSMRGINVAILNGWFGICIGGALVFTALSVVLHLRGGGRPALPWIIAGLVLYLAVLGVTAAANVPLNDKLAAAVGDPAVARKAFESAWVAWNVVRSALSLFAFGALCWALLLQGRLQELGR